MTDSQKVVLPAGLEGLRLDEALRLLRSTGRVDVTAGGCEGLELVQRIIDGLCDLSLSDGLTGLANPRHFRLALDRELERVARSGQWLSLLLVDLDYFKQVNDMHGHPAGNEVLRRVAAALRDGARTMDLVARFGGEEFAVIMPDCLPHNSRRIAERLRRRVAATVVDLPGGDAVRVNASVGGAAVAPWQRIQGDSLIDMADRQLYLAKRAGRDRVAFEEPPSNAATEDERSMLLDRAGGAAGD